MAYIPSSQLDDLLLQIVKTLTESKETLDKIEIPQLLMPVINVQDVHRFFSNRINATNTKITLKAPLGKVWKVHYVYMAYTCSVAVADREVDIVMRNGQEQGIQTIFKETLAASAVGTYQMGTPVPSAHAYGDDCCDDKPTLCDEASLQFYAGANGQAADTLMLTYLVEEWNNYARE